MARLTKEGALVVGQDFGKLIGLIERRAADLGVPEKVASDWVRRTKILASNIQKSALTEYDPVKEQGFNPDDIGREVSGPLTQDGDETYMDQHFTQQTNRELRNLVEQGKIGPDKAVEEPQAPSPGKQAADRPFVAGADEQKDEPSAQDKKDDDGADKTAAKKADEGEGAEKGEDGLGKPGKDEKDEGGEKKGKKAAIDESIARLQKKADEAQITNLGAIADGLKMAAYKLDAAGGAGGIVAALKKLVASLDKVRETVIKAGANGFDDDPGVLEEADKVATASSEVLPFVTALADGLYASKDGASPTAQLRAQELLDQSNDKITKLIGLAQKIVDNSSKAITGLVDEVTGKSGDE